MDGTGYGFMVDTYCDAIHELAQLYSIASDDQVLGYTMAHELGHLLIGPGHRSDGIMRAAWGRQELESLKRRHLTFNAWERSAIVHQLRMRRDTSRVPIEAGLQRPQNE